MADLLEKIASYIPSTMCVMWVLDEPECPKSLIK